MKKAIVTGANGFIGSFLVKELIKNNVEAIAVDRRGTDWNNFLDLPVTEYECNLNEICKLPEIIPDRDIDCIFHIAWQGISDRDAKEFNVQLKNIEASLELIEAANKMSIKTVVGAGSISETEVMHEMSLGCPIDNLSHMYKTAKLAAHWMGKTMAGYYGIRFFWPLIINAYGEQENSARLINSFVRKIMSNESPELSEGTQYYDFVHVSDVAHALYLIAEKGIDGKDYIIGSGNAKPLKNFLTEAGDIVNEMKGGEKISLGFGKYKGKAISLPKEAFDSSSLAEDTGFQPQMSFREGIERTVRWISKEKGE